MVSYYSNSSRQYRRSATAMTTRAANRQPRRRPGLLARLAVLGLASALPGVSAWAGDRNSSSAVADVAHFASAIERGIATVQEGIVSWYGAQFQDRKTASGERFDSAELTMAHPKLPFGTQVKVTNLRNGRSVVVRVNDRGPYVGSRIADLSEAAASEIGMLRKGLAKVRIEVLGGDDEEESASDKPAVVTDDEATRPAGTIVPALTP